MKCISCDYKIKGLTEKPVFLKAGTDGTAGTGGQYILFGNWPQTVKSNDIIIDESKIYKFNAFDCYKGNDGYYYVKEIAKSEDKSYGFSNGETVVKGKSYYFKIESIKWRILDNNFYGGNLLLAEKALISGSFDNHYDYDEWKGIDRKINGKNIHANNYEYSRIRAYLNCLNGTSYDVDDFRENGFINKAFSKKAIGIINTIKVDNGIESTTYCGHNIDKSDDYICNDTMDKIFLLSEKDVTNKAYGFDSFDRFIGDKYGSKTSSRIIENTDYSLATGVYISTRDSINSCQWWLRSPVCDNGDDVQNVLNGGRAANFAFIDYSNGAVVPALSISI